MGVNFRWTLLAGVLFFITAGFSDLAAAKVIYVDPEYAKNRNSDGSKDAPFRDLNRLLKSKHIAAGDIVRLASGVYGSLFLNGKKYSSKVVIEADKDEDVRFGKIRIWQSQNIHLRGLKVSPSFLKRHSQKTIVEVDRGSTDITLENLDIFSAPSVEGWTKEKWLETVAKRGIFSRGERHFLINNKVRNIYYGIETKASRSRVIGNVVENFAVDGIRGLGDYTLFENNLIKNCFQIDGNHADGFQSWSVGKNGKAGAGVVKGVVLRKNRILNFTDYNQPYRCEMQGIGMFDGFYEDWIIENNIVVADHWHGISIYGAKNVRIQNNTVFDPVRGNAGPAWIKIVPHKDGRPSTRSLIANNLSSGKIPFNNGVLLLKNMHVPDEEDVYENPSKFNFRLLPDSRAVDAGMPNIGIRDDINGIKRPLGKSIDIGAIESR